MSRLQRLWHTTVFWGVTSTTVVYLFATAGIWRLRRTIKKR